MFDLLNLQRGSLFLFFSKISPFDDCAPPPEICNGWSTGMLIGQARETDQIVLTRSALKEERRQKIVAILCPFILPACDLIRIIIRSSVSFNILADEPEGWTEGDAKLKKNLANCHLLAKSYICLTAMTSCHWRRSSDTLN